MTTEFKLYPPQQLALVTAAKEVLYGGAAGGGKSYLARVASIVYCLEIPGLVVYLFRRTFKEVLANHIYTPGGYLEMLKDLIDNDECTFSKSDYSFTFYNGSRIQLAHSQYESDIYTHQGAQIGLLIIDEATHFTPDMIRFIRSRVRLGSMKVPDKYKHMFPRILYTANPGGVGHHYFKSGFVDFGTEPHHAPEDEGSMLRLYVPAKLTDNKVMLQNDPEYKQRIMGLSDEKTVKGMLDGDWEALSEGSIADVWRAKFHVVVPFTIPHTWKIDRGYDYGSANPAAFCWFAESDGSDFVDAAGNECWVPAGTIFQIGELYLADKKYNGLRLSSTAQAERAKQYEEDEGLKGRVIPGPADNAIFSSEPGTKTIADDMAAIGIKFIRSNKSPGSRKQGLQLFRTRLQNGVKRPMERPGYFVFNNCVHTIRTVPSLQPDPDNKEDVDTTGEDHIWDVVRYRVLKSALRASTTKVSGT